jgi:SAM-dependent methyltransferase
MDECPLYSDPHLYDLLFPQSNQADDEARRARLRASEQFYLDESRRVGGRVLELGCGSGRLTIPIAQAGVDITGADLSQSMLDAARSKAVTAGVAIEFVQADMRTFDLGHPFAVIVIPGNSLLHLLSIDELKQCFRRVRSQLTSGGKFVFDISKWDLARLAVGPEERRPVMTAGNIAIEETAEFDSATQVRRILWYVKNTASGETRVIDHSLRVIFPQELLLLIELTGFRLDVRYGEFTREPFGPSSPRQVCICSKLD